MNNEFFIKYKENLLA